MPSTVLRGSFDGSELGRRRMRFHARPASLRMMAGIRYGIQVFHHDPCIHCDGKSASLVIEPFGISTHRLRKASRPSAARLTGTAVRESTPKKCRSSVRYQQVGHGTPAGSSGNQQEMPRAADYTPGTMSVQEPLLDSQWCGWSPLTSGTIGGDKRGDLFAGDILPGRLLIEARVVSARSLPWTPRTGLRRAIGFLKRTAPIVDSHQSALRDDGSTAVPTHRECHGDQDSPKGSRSRSGPA